MFLRSGFGGGPEAREWSFFQFNTFKNVASLACFSNCKIKLLFEGVFVALLTPLWT